MQEKSKAASYSEPIQILTLVPDKWSRMYCSEYFNSHEIKKLGELLAKPGPENQMVCSGWLKNDSLCLRMKRSSKCVACRCNGQRLDIQRPDQINFVLI